MKKIQFIDREAEKIYEKIKNKDYKIKKVLKKDQRSEVYLIDILGKEYVYKVPLEKNRRKWQRFLSIFRGGESEREYKSYLKVLENGFKGPRPVMYCEEKKCLMTVDSFFISEYLEGKEGTLNELEIVSKELEKIHKKGYLHGDSQLSNFIIKDDEVYLIDAKLKKNIYFKPGEVYEFIYLEESCHKEIDVYKKKGISYFLAKTLNRYLHFIGDLKNRLKGKE